MAEPVERALDHAYQLGLGQGFGIATLLWIAIIVFAFLARAEGW